MNRTHERQSHLSSRSPSPTYNHNVASRDTHITGILKNTGHPKFSGYCLKESTCHQGHNPKDKYPTSSYSKNIIDESPVVKLDIPELYFGEG